MIATHSEVIDPQSKKVSRRLGRLVGGLSLVVATAAAPTVLMASGASAAPTGRTSPCEGATYAAGTVTSLVNGRTLAGLTWRTTGVINLSASFHDAAGKVIPLQRFSCIGTTRIGVSSAPAKSMLFKAKGDGLLPIYAVIKGTISRGAYVKLSVVTNKGKVITSGNFPLFYEPAPTTTTTTVAPPL